MASGRCQRKKKGQKSAVRRAEKPGQTLNADLCFVPATHEAEQKLPAVSGSSGRLVVKRAAGDESEKQWPGKVFEDQSRDYTEVMLDYVAASKAQSAPSETAQGKQRAALKAKKQALRQEEAKLGDQRRALRQERKAKDTAWDIQKAKRRELKAKSSAKEGRADNEFWSIIRKQRRDTKLKRKDENKLWRQKRLSLRERLSQLPIVTAWIAILVIVDNCTRQCLGLPLFVVGPKVTSQMIIEALSVLLPPDLHFLITDRGTHFIANTFEQLAENSDFIHVLIARHRPHSNGIAERFIRTFKESLMDKSWNDDIQLDALIAQFLTQYNDRPHQGLPIPGLSPNEFAKRSCEPSS